MAIWPDTCVQRQCVFAGGFAQRLPGLLCGVHRSQPWDHCRLAGGGEVTEGGSPKPDMWARAGLAPNRLENKQFTPRVAVADTYAQVKWPASLNLEVAGAATRLWWRTDQSTYGPWEKLWESPAMMKSSSERTFFLRRSPMRSIAVAVAFAVVALACAALLLATGSRPIAGSVKVSPVSVVNATGTCGDDAVGPLASSVAAVAFSADGRFLMAAHASDAGSPGRLTRWDLSSGCMVETHETAYFAAQGTSFDGSARWVVSTLPKDGASGGGVAVWSRRRP